MSTVVIHAETLWIRGLPFSEIMAPTTATATVSASDPGQEYLPPPDGNVAALAGVPLKFLQEMEGRGVGGVE